MNTIDSTKLIELAKADYKMLKEKGKDGEEVLHYNGFLDGFARGLHEGSNPWHKASEELPEPLAYVIVRFSNNTMAVSQRTNHFIGETTTVKVTHWMPIPEIKED